MSSASAQQAQWLSIGRSLLETFGHVAVLSLPRARKRRAHMRRLLEPTLGLEATDYSMIDALDCEEYGRWRGLSLLDVAHAPARAGAPEESWWLTDQTCSTTGSLAPPSCLHPGFAPCRNASAPGLAEPCKYVCYTLSVAVVLRGFLASNHTRMLLLEDDVCPTPALLHAAPILSQLRRNPGWEVVRLGHCHPCDRTMDSPRRFDGYASCVHLSHGRQGVPSDKGHGHPAVPSEDDPDWEPNVLHRSLGKLFCAHALGVSRRGAERLLRLALPVSAVFDDMLAALGGTRLRPPLLPDTCTAALTTLGRGGSFNWLRLSGHF
jgi:hypothetical protein